MVPKVFLIILCGITTVKLCNAEIIQVCARCQFQSIKQAIQVSKSGDIVEVLPGTYAESNVVIDKSIHLKGISIGDELPIIDAHSNGNGIIINASHVIISHLSIRNFGVSYVEDLAGIKVTQSDDCKIIENKISGPSFAIHIAQTNQCLVESNSIIGSNRSESSAGNGIHIWNGKNMVIRGNSITGHRDGIYFEFVKNSLILGNRSQENMRYGLHFMFSDGNEYQNNIFKKNASGVAVMYSRNIQMRHNRFEESWGGASYGVLLKDITTSIIENNLFKGNTVGVYMEGTTRSQLKYNILTLNGWGVRLLGNSDGNEIALNNFIHNTFDLTTNATHNLNVIRSNFWSEYRGLDTNHDGIGDSSFQPVKLSSLLIEKYGVSVLLLKSFFFALIDKAEEIFPLLIPDSFQDDRPLMVPSRMPSEL